METKEINGGPKPFRFVNAWCSHPEFLSFVEKAWTSYDIEGWGGFKVKEKLKRLKEDLKKWNIEIFGSMEHKISKLKDDIQELDLYDDVFGLEETEMIKRKEVTAELFRCLNQRNNLLAQKAKIRWLKEGDVNSKFFHRAINFRRKGNGIARLLLYGQWTEDVKVVKDGVGSFFKKHFSQESIARPKLTSNLFSKKLSPADNSFLSAPFTDEEVKSAVDNCENSKSSGPDGFNFKFIKVCWAVIKEDFLQMISDFHVHGKLVRGINPSFIALIPKKEDATCLSDYRPISLIGCAYKILAKLLAFRLSKVMDKLISTNQSAFVGKRNIMDGIVILNEAVAEAKRRKLERAFFKIDFAKAYDSVD